MESKNLLYNRYYDKIFSAKNYENEVSTVLSLYNKRTGKKPERILDIGCGTGTHGILLARKSKYILGLDTDKGAIKIAKSKALSAGQENAKFDSIPLNQVTEKKFDLAVSLFNVVNYIGNLNELIKTFSEISSRLQSNGVFIFDCWNGVATIIDRPRKVKKRILLGHETLEVTSIPKIDLFNQSVLMQNNVRVKASKQADINFSFSYQSTLWTPKIVRDALEETGFTKIQISTWKSPHKQANYKNWKILFTCQKKK